jgi:hypothetical protein
MRFNWYGQQFKLNVKYAIHNVLNEIGTQGVAEIKQSFPEGSFRKWRSKRTNVKWHWSSRPGQPPSVDTARLLESIRYDMERETDGERLRISANTEYALAQELGYAPKGLKPRPYLQPQLEIIRTKAMTILKSNMGQILK